MKLPGVIEFRAEPPVLAKFHRDADPWIEPWLTVLLDRAGAAPVLELGCGIGSDTLALVDAGLSVVAIDLSPDAIEQARGVVRNAEFQIGDVRDSFPLRTAPVVIASLSLHYFGWAETVAIVERIHTTLGPRGLLICRVNSTNDHNFGASGYSRIEEDYYLVEDRPKRFFSRDSIAALFGAGWRTIHVAERTIQRYTKQKVVWEVVVEKDG